MSTGVFTTKRYTEKNSRDYTGVGDAYGKKVPKQASTIGAQFQTNPPRRGQTAGYFNKATYSTGNMYLDTKTYRNVQPLQSRRLGFTSHDARRRDEFALDIRARQWKEKLKTESKFARASVREHTAPPDSQPRPGETHQQMKERKYTEKYADKPELFQTQVPYFLYDIGKTANTPFNNKSSVDTFYDLKRVAQMGVRRPGSNPTSYETYGNYEVDVTKPKYGSVNVTKQFYDHSHLSI